MFTSAIDSTLQFDSTTWLVHLVYFPSYSAADNAYVVLVIEGKRADCHDKIITTQKGTVIKLIDSTVHLAYEKLKSQFNGIEISCSYNLPEMENADCYSLSFKISPQQAAQIICQIEQDKKLLGLQQHLNSINSKFSIFPACKSLNSQSRYAWAREKLLPFLPPTTLPNDISTFQKVAKYHTAFCCIM